jgi:hypothetical protein
MWSVIVQVITSQPTEPLNNSTGMRNIKSENYSGEPSFRLVIRSDNPSVGRGDPFNFDIYISGAGDVEWAKLFFLIPKHLAETIKLTQEEINAKKLNPDQKYKVKITYLEFDQIDNSGFKDLKELTLKEKYVTHIFNTTLANWNLNRVMHDQNSLFCVGETNQKGHAPICCSLTIDEYAPSGDHEIALNLAYKDAILEKWYTNSHSLKIHVKNWYETDEVKYLSVAYIIIQLLLVLWRLVDP